MGVPKNSEKKYHCTLHRHNTTNDSKDCFALKKKAAQNGGSFKNGKSNKDAKRSFSNRSFRKEVNMLAKGSSKMEVLALYENAVKREKKKLVKSAKKHKAVILEGSDSSDSDSDLSVQVIERPAVVKKRKVTFNEMREQLQDSLAKRERARLEREATLPEEQAFLAKVVQMEEAEKDNAPQED